MDPENRFPNDKRSFRRFAREILEQVKEGKLEGEFFEFSGDPATDAANLNNFLDTNVADTGAAERFASDAKEFREAMASVADFTRIARYDDAMIAKLDLVASKVFIAIKAGDQLTLSSAELVTSKGEAFQGFVKGGLKIQVFDGRHN